MTHENLLNDVRDVLYHYAKTYTNANGKKTKAQKALTRLDAFLADVPDNLERAAQFGDSKIAWECQHLLHTATTKGKSHE